MKTNIFEFCEELNSLLDPTGNLKEVEAIKFGKKFTYSDVAKVLGYGLTTILLDMGEFDPIYSMINKLKPVYEINVLAGSTLVDLSRIIRKFYEDKPIKVACSEKYNFSAKLFKDMIIIFDYKFDKTSQGIPTECLILFKDVSKVTDKLLQSYYIEYRKYSEELVFNYPARLSFPVYSNFCELPESSMKLHNLIDHHSIFEEVLDICDDRLYCLGGGDDWRRVDMMIGDTLHIFTYSCDTGNGFIHYNDRFIYLNPYVVDELCQLNTNQLQFILMDLKCGSIQSYNSKSRFHEIEFIGYGNFDGLKKYKATNYKLNKLILKH